MKRDPGSRSLQDAKARFSAVVDAALDGATQHVRRRGKKAVVVIAESEYQRPMRAERVQTAGVIDHLLAVPREAARRDTAERRELRLRDVSLR